MDAEEAVSSRYAGPMHTRILWRFAGVAALGVTALGVTALGVTALCTVAVAEPPASPQYKYFRVGSPKDVATATQAGFALMGGGKDLDEAFRWMCLRAGGGDFLVLRATGDDDYNPYIQPLCKLNSVATLILPNREAANNPNDPFVAETIAHAEAIFIAGGDQANYVRFWQGTPVQAEINKAIQRGVPIGGTSAGLAVLGEWAYSAEGDKPDDPNLDSKTALMNPLVPRVTLVHGFLEIPILKGIITDSHFAKRDRMGRLLAFLFRCNEPDGREEPTPSFKIRGIGVDQGAAVLVEPDGAGAVVGGGSGYFVEQTRAAFVQKADDLLTGMTVAVQKVRPGSKFNLKSWKGDAIRYELSIQGSKVISSQTGGSLY
jgi:cyanophycinase